MNPAKPELNLNIKTHDAHVAELVHQNFGIFGRFSGFDMSGTHGIEGGSQVGRVLGPDRGPDAGAGMTEFELHGVQPLPVKSQGLRQHRIGTIHGVAAQGMPNRGEMHANLMRASGFEIHRNQRRLAESVQHVPMRDRRLARRRDAEAEVRHLGAADGRFDGGLVLLEVAWTIA